MFTRAFQVLTQNQRVNQFLTKILDHHGWRKDSSVVSRCKWTPQPPIILLARNDDPCFWIHRSGIVLFLNTSTTWFLDEMMQKSSSSKCILSLEGRNEDLAHVIHSQTIDRNSLAYLWNLEISISVYLSILYPVLVALKHIETLTTHAFREWIL